MAQKSTACDMCWQLRDLGEAFECSKGEGLCKERGPTEDTDAGYVMNYRYASTPCLRVTFTTCLLSILPLCFLLPQWKFTLAPKENLFLSKYLQKIVPATHASFQSQLVKLQFKLIYSVISKIHFK